MESSGEPVKYGELCVTQMDHIPIFKGKLTINFLGGNSEIICGIVLKSTKGHIILPNGKKVKALKIWDEKTLPNVVDYRVECPDGELKVWNIYRIAHKSGLVTEDAWTNNACMHVQELSPFKRRYSCSDGMGEVDLENHLFELNWETTD